MPLFTPEDRRLAEAVSALQDANPFLPERLELERRVLGDDAVFGDVWHKNEDSPQRHATLDALALPIDDLARRARRRLVEGGRSLRRTLDAEELRLYEDLILYRTYHQFEGSFFQLIERRGAATARIAFFDEYQDDVRHFLGEEVLGEDPARREGTASSHDAAHLFALSFQIRRAFHHAFRYILGGSMPAARLRAAVWQSIFSHDMRRYRRFLYARMGEFTTLITGPSGTGKELVAQSIGKSRYIPFDPARRCFVADPEQSFHPLNLSALSPTLIESELFGHRRGSFTGATNDRSGWLELCTEHGTVFLDEIGEVDPAIQVKLLRLLQTRAYQRLGETQERHFVGKIITATNRDLDAEMAAGRFREDFYYRLCADRIVTPSLAEQLAGADDELRRLIELLAQRMVGADEAPALAGECADWIRQGLPADYPWPGNVRELEQCVRNVLIRREYQPPRGRATDPAQRLARDLADGALSADELVSRYCALVFARCGSYSETGRRIGLDRRTVKAKILAFRDAEGSES